MLGLILKEHWVLALIVGLLGLGCRAGTSKGLGVLFPEIVEFDMLAIIVVTVFMKVVGI